MEEKERKEETKKQKGKERKETSIESTKKEEEQGGGRRRRLSLSSQRAGSLDLSLSRVEANAHVQRAIQTGREGIHRGIQLDEIAIDVIRHDLLAMILQFPQVPYVSVLLPGF